MGNKQAIKIKPSTFRFIANLDLFCLSFIKDADLFPEDIGRDELDARGAEFMAGLPYCSPYAISAGDMTPRRFEYKGKFIQFSPSPNGLPTIRDLDVLIYCTTWIANAALDGRDADVGLTYEFDVGDFYRFAHRQKSGERETLFIQGLERLAGSTITTNTRPDKLDNHAFNYIDRYELIRDDAGRLVSVRAEFPHTICSLVFNEFFDPIHADYFDLPATHRLIYLFLQQYCGYEKMPVSCAKLRSITGSTTPEQKFWPQTVENLIQNQLPDFHCEKGKGMTVCFNRVTDTFTASQLAQKISAGEMPAIW